MNLKLIKIETLNDVEIIKEFFHDVFPEEPGYDCIDFTNSVTGNHNYKRLEYYLIKFENDIVGFCGIYSNNDNEAWLGWFGIKPQFRRKGYARQMLHILKDKMIEYGYKIVRTYTDKKLNNNAYKLYLSDGFVQDNEYEYDFVTMVCYLDNTKITDEKLKTLKWIGTPLGFESEPPHHAN